MPDTLRTRVARVIAGGTHALLDRLEDAAPVAMLEQNVREIVQITDDVRAELGRVVANRHLAQQQQIHLKDEHRALSDSLAAALAGERDDLARPAIARQLDIEAQLPVLEASLAELTLQEKELSSYVDALMGKRREMDKAIRDLENSRRQADSLPPGSGASAGRIASKVQAAQAAFDRTFQRQTGLDPAARGATLAQAAQLAELGELVRENKIAERLAALKAKP